MPALIERRKMTRATYQALKRHIMRERAKRKSEQEADLALERQKKELERRKRLENENKNSLQQTKDEIVRLNKLLDDHRKEKSKLFGQLKKLLDMENAKKESEKKLEPHFPMGQVGHPNPSMHFLNGTGHAMGRPVLYKPTHTPDVQASGSSHDISSSSLSSAPAAIKRQRSVSPPGKPLPSHPMYQFGSEFGSTIYSSGSVSSSTTTQPSKAPPAVSKPPPSMYHSTPSKYGHSSQSPFSPFMSSQHGSGQPVPNPPAHAGQKHAALGLVDSFSGRGLAGQKRMEGGPPEPLMTHGKHRAPPPGIPPAVPRHSTPIKGGIMSGFPVHNTNQGHPSQPPLGMIPGAPGMQPMSDRNPYPQRDVRHMFPR